MIYKLNEFITFLYTCVRGMWDICTLVCGSACVEGQWTVSGVRYYALPYSSEAESTAEPSGRLVGI